MATKPKQTTPYDQFYHTTLATGFQTEKVFLRNAGSEQLQLMQDVLANRNMFLKEKVQAGKNVFGFSN